MSAADCEGTCTVTTFPCRSIERYVVLAPSIATIVALGWSAAVLLAPTSTSAIQRNLTVITRDKEEWCAIRASPRGRVVLSRSCALRAIRYDEPVQAAAHAWERPDASIPGIERELLYAQEKQQGLATPAP